LLSLGCIHFFGPEQLFMIDTYVVGSFRHFWLKGGSTLILSWLRRK
jgi:hypothetical protein